MIINEYCTYYPAFLLGFGVGHNANDVHYYKIIM